MQKRWTLVKDVEEQKVAELAEQLTITPLLAKMLINRGITDFETARLFFRPLIAHLHDPFLMNDMDKAIERIELAIQQEEKILVYGDYDVDGTTSVALVYTFFSKFYKQIFYYIPNRYSEGYGISIAGVDYAAENGYSLIVALDCGIKAADKVAYATAKKIDFIICDHHLPDTELPKAVAILDPKRVDNTYPYTELSGCGIGLKLIQAYAQKHQMHNETWLSLLDLVAVSIASDIVPITGENRVLAYYGLEKLNTDACMGLQILMQMAGTKKQLTISDVVFSIGPRINAAGRIDDAKKSVELLIAATKEEAEERCQIINVNNTERRTVDSTITTEALEMIAADSDSATRSTTVLYNPNWSKGVIGIVASRLIEKHYRPTIILTESNGKAAGSARSVNGFDVYNAIDACSDLLEQFGGHMYAAGLTLAIDKVPQFQDKFEAVVKASITQEALTQAIDIDAELSFSEINPKFVRILNQFEPFGPCNMKPVFVSHGVYCKTAPQVVGTNHLKMQLYQNAALAIGCIGFGLSEFTTKIRVGERFSVCYTIEENEWNGNKSIQLNIKDIKITD